ncbi:hypothetical protein [Rickettsiella endosymbiont of Dermanyssus gallinae]|uniref:hypothetical protein n=1 Tax=Rickettsiella endosymbiont of Dermanyssus gallinae TaxID=2856608 RepID=UPI001C52F921|nr:hypothetical protein [Rickettsiella endosymbiont of Dermanyssus gallinae]
MTHLIHQRLLQVKTQIAEAEHRFQRLNHSVKLIAVSKSQAIPAIKEAIDAGQFVFEENYVQEALEKIKQLQANHLEWHFLGAFKAIKLSLLLKIFTGYIASVK